MHSEGDEADIIDMAFVDDLGVVLFATNPHQLCDATHTLLDIIAELFHFFMLQINWNKGKTEAFVKFRGKKSSAYYQRLRTERGFGFTLNFNGMFLNVVTSCKRLGSLT